MNTLFELPPAGRTRPGRFNFIRRLAAALALACLLVAPPARAVDPPPDGRQFETLLVGGVKHTKVTIIDVAARHVSFRSAQGFSTVLLSDLEPEVRAKLGRGELDLSEAWKTPGGTAGKDGKDGKGMVVKAREPGDPGDSDAGTQEGQSFSPAGLLERPVEWTFRNIAAACAVGLGLLVVVVAHCWFIGVAFRTSAGWGIAVLIGTFFLGILHVMFCRSHWGVAKRPVFLNFAGLALIALGAFSLASTTRLEPEPVTARETPSQTTNTPPLFKKVQDAVQGPRVSETGNE